MAKELPFFKFYTGEWIAGDITMCSMEAQGLFINICAHYWNKGNKLSIANAKQRFSNCLEQIEELIFQEIIKLDEDENIIIEFLDEQLNEFSSISRKRASAGRKGGKANAKQMLSKKEAKSSNKEKIREDKNKNIEERQSKFLKEIQSFESRYGKDICMAFYNYWSEPNRSKTKMRCELEKTWDTKRRLDTWERRSSEKKSNTNSINSVWDNQ